MKRYFEYMDKYMIRLPKNSSDHRVNNYDEEYIEQLCKDKVFREQVLISSKNLYDMMDMYIKNGNKMSSKKKRNFLESIIKYDIRSKTRTTPFGLFSLVGLGSFSDTNQLKVNTESIYKGVKVDSEWLFKLIKNLEEKYIGHLLFKLNDAVWEKGNRFALIYSVDEKKEEISMRKTGVFDIISHKCQVYVSMDEVIDELKKAYTDTSVDMMMTYLKQLINKGILISDLRPPFNIENQFKYFVDKLKAYKVDRELVNVLKEIEEMCEQYCKLKVGEGEGQFLEIIHKMSDLQKAKGYLKVDMGLNQKDIKLNYKQGQNMSELASLFTLLTNPVKEDYGYLDDYRTKFMEKYGVDREVPILEMLDQSIGIGAPWSYTNPKNNIADDIVHERLYNDKLKNYLILAYIDAVAHHKDIEISEEEIKRICGSTLDEKEIPISLELFFVVKNVNGELEFNISPSVGSTAAGKTFGRFTYLSEDFKELVKQTHQKDREIRDDRVTICDINFLPGSSRDGNVVQNVSFKDKELVFYTSSTKKEEDIIKVNNILIGVENDRFYARDKVSGRLLVFDLNNMYNPYLTSNVIRFLQDIELNGYRKWNNFPWIHVYNKFKYVPRIKLKNIIIANKKYVINNEDLSLGNKFTYEEFKEKFKAFCEKIDIDDKVYLTKADNRMMLDLTQEYSIKLLYQEFERSGNLGIELEGVEQGEDVLVNQDGEKHTLEIVPAFFRKNKEVIDRVPREKYSAQSNIVRDKLPFDEWLYLKLYGDKERQDELIAFEILEFCDQLKREHGVEYFFMRYKDTKPHIRLRFHAKGEVLMSVYPLILNWINKIRNNHVIADMSISTYEREVERYGGEKLIDYAEQIFFSDSLVVASLIRYSRMKMLPYSIEEIGVISILQYLKQFRLSYDTQALLLESSYYNVKFMPEFKAQKDKYLELCDIENDWAKLNESQEGQLLLTVLSQRQQAIDAYLKVYNEVGERDIYNILLSIMHLHCNRLMGTDRELENKIMSYCERIIHAKKFLLKNKTVSEGENESKQTS